jgi:hypothetical protein
MPRATTNNTLTGDYKLQTAAQAAHDASYALYSAGILGDDVDHDGSYAEVTFASLELTGELSCNTLLVGGVAIGSETDANISDLSTNIHNHFQFINDSELKVKGDITVDGSFAVMGGVTHIKSTRLDISDGLIELATSNPSDNIDIGFYGRYTDTTTQEALYTGLYREKADGDFKLFKGLGVQPSNIGVTSSFDIAQLHADVSAGTIRIANNLFFGGVAIPLTDIATNTAQIATNTSSIASNTLSIASNTANIVTNAATMAAAVAAATAADLVHTTVISANTAQITTNATQIATNVTDIFDLSAAHYGLLTPTGIVTSNTINATNALANAASTLQRVIDVETDIGFITQPPTGEVAGELIFETWANDEDSGYHSLHIKTPGAAKLIVSGDLSMNGAITSSGTITAQGDITAFYSSSDKRLKTNIETIDNALSIIDNLRGVRFDWNENALKLNNNVDLNKRELGVIAQEIEKELPEVIKEGLGGYMAVRYEKITPVLIAAIKEQQIMIKQQDERISNLENSQK